MRHHLTLLKWPILKSSEITTAVGDVVNKEPSFTVGWTLNWVSLYEETDGDFSKN